MNQAIMDYSLYLVTDRSLSRGRSNREIVEAAISGGVSCVQLREKNCSTREFVREALALKALLSPKKIPLIVNDRIDVALACGAEGIHLGQTDMHIRDARRICGKSLVIGISAESVEDAVRAEQEGADYIGVSPVFSTPTKTDTAPPLGLRGIRKIRDAVHIPIVGIGGIQLHNATEIIHSGADGIAVVSAIVSAESPKDAAQELKSALGKQR